MPDELTLSIDHVSLSVQDLPKVAAFYTAALAPLGLEKVAELSGEQSGSFACAGFGRGRKGQLWLVASGLQTPRGHLCFRAATRASVRDFYAQVIHARGTDNGPPGIRDIYHPAYYAAFVSDPEGHNIEAVCFMPEVPE